jgi:hypothetical protein
LIASLVKRVHWKVNYEYELDEFSTKLEICFLSIAIQAKISCFMKKKKQDTKTYDSARPLTNVSRNVQTFHETSRKINKILQY